MKKLGETKNLKTKLKRSKEVANLSSGWIFTNWIV